MSPECPACGERGAPWRAAHQVIRGRVRPEELTLWRCRTCGSGWLPGPAPPNTAELHRTGSYRAGSAIAERLPRLAGFLDRDRLRLLGDLRPGSRVIELGAGRGRLVRALRSRGHDAVGIEPYSPASAGESAAQQVRAASVEEAEFPPSEADMIVFWHVLEHLERPMESLSRASQWLRPGGRAVIALPNLGSLQARLGGDRWFHQDVPRHRTQFTLEGVMRLSRRCGLEPRATHHLMLEQNVLGMWLTLLNGFTVNRDVPYRAAKGDLSYDRRLEAARDAVAATLVGLPLLPVAALLELGAGVRGRAGTVVVWAERR